MDCLFTPTDETNMKLIIFFVFNILENFRTFWKKNYLSLLFKEILSKIFQITDSDNNKSSEIFWLVCEKSFTFWNSIVLYLILKLIALFFLQRYDDPSDFYTRHLSHRFFCFIVACLTKKLFNELVTYYGKVKQILAFILLLNDRVFQSVSSIFHL